MLKFNRHLTATFFFTLYISLFSSQTYAALIDFQILLDADNNSATGCDITTGHGVFVGAEYQISTVVDNTLTPAQISSHSYQLCTNPATNSFGPPVPIPPGNWLVGINVGTSGSDMVETLVPKSLVTSETVRFSVIADNGEGGTDALPDNAAQGLVIDVLTFIPTPVPTLGQWAVAVISLLLAFVGYLVIRRYGTNGATIVLVITLSSSSVGLLWAAILDGNIADWLGIPPIATDPTGDPGSSPDSDILALFYRNENGDLCFRFDINELIGVPEASNDNFNSLPNAPIEDAGLFNVAAPGVLTNDLDPKFTGLTAILDVDVSNGTLVLNGDGSFNYTPAADFFGIDTFTYHNNDGSSDSNIATVTIDVQPVNDQPSFTASNPAAVNEDAGAQSLPGWVSSFNPGAINEAGQTATYQVTSVQTPALFSAGPTVAANGTLSYTPTANASGSSTFNLAVQDNGGTTNSGVDTSANQNFTITVNPVDDPPVAQPDITTVLENASATAINVLLNDTDIDAGTKLITSITQPANGTVVITGGGTGLTYQPDADYCNDGTPTDDFTYTLTPGGSSTTVAVTVTCVTPPVVTGETYDTIGNTTLEVNTTSSVTPAVFVNGNVLSNDTNGGSGVLQVSTTGTYASTNGGSVTMAANGTFTFTPLADDAGPDSFTYDVTNDGGTTTASGTVTINIQQMVWYVDNSVTGPGTGVSSDPFKTLTTAATASAAGETIYVRTGDGLVTEQNAGITLKNNQRLHGEGVALAFTGLTLNGVGPTTHTLNAAGTKPKITNTTPMAPTVTIANVLGTEVRGLDIDGTWAGIHLSANAAFDSSALISDNAINLPASNAQAVVISHDSSGTLTADVNSNTLTAASNALDATKNATGDLLLVFNNNTGITSAAPAESALHIEDTAGTGTLFVTSFANNTVLGTSAGAGVHILGATFDSDPSDADFDPVIGGNLNLGIVADRIRSGAVFGTAAKPVSGNLGFSTASIYTFNGAALTANGSALSSGGTPPVNGFLLAIAGGVPDSIGGPAVAFDTLTSNTTLPNLSNTGSGGPGVSLDGIDGIFNVAAGAIVNSSAPGFEIIGGSVGVTFGGAIVQGNNAPLVSVSGGHTGTVTFQTGTISATNGNGLQFNNADGIYNFNGTTTLNGGDAGIDIVNGSSGNFTFGGSTGITNPTGIAFKADGGNGTINYNGVINNNAGRAVDIQNRTGGTVAFAGSIAETGTGVFMNNNTGATINYTGGMNLTTTTNTAFTATSGGTVNATGTNTATTTTGTAINIAHTIIGATGVTFQSVTANGGTNGIVLIDTGSNGGFTVTGTGTASSGGIIQNMAGANGTNSGIGVFLNTTKDVSLTNMQLNDFSNFAIRGTTVTGFTLANSVINGVNGNSAGDDEGSVSFDNLLGSASLTNNNISGGFEDNIVVTNTSGTLNRMTVSGGTIGLNSNASGNDGILIEAQNSAVANLTVTDTTFLGSRGDHIQANALGNSSMDIIIQDNTFQNAHGNSLGGGITISGGAAGSNIAMTYDISGTTPGAQTFKGSVGSAITANIVNGSGNITGTIQNNQIGESGTAGSGSTTGFGISVGSQVSTTHNVTINNNIIDGISGAAGIDVISNGSSAVNAIITNNNVNELSGNAPFAAINTISGGASVSDTASLCVHVSGNTLDSSGANFPIGDIFVDQISSASSYNFPGYGGPNTGGALLDAFLTGQNTINGNAVLTTASNNITGFGTTCP